MNFQQRVWSALEAEATAHEIATRMRDDVDVVRVTLRNMARYGYVVRVSASKGAGTPAVWMRGQPLPKNQWRHPNSLANLRRGPLVNGERQAKERLAQAERKMRDDCKRIGIDCPKCALALCWRGV